MRNLFRFRRAKKKSLRETCSMESRADTSTEVVAMVCGEDDGQDIEGRLVVMGRESVFSQEVVDYAIDMARRMSFEILALNSTPLSCDAFSMRSASRKKLCEEFISISEKNAMAFRQAAESAGVPFAHVVKFDQPDQALTSVQQEYKNIEFVISDAQPQSVEQADQAADASRPRSEVLVYSMI
jgi:hypothetical protein